MQNTTLKIIKSTRSSLLTLLIITFSNNLLAEDLFIKLETSLSPLVTKKVQKPQNYQKILYLKVSNQKNSL